MDGVIKRLRELVSHLERIKTKDSKLKKRISDIIDYYLEKIESAICEIEFKDCEKIIDD